MRFSVRLLDSQGWSIGYSLLVFFLFLILFGRSGVFLTRAITEFASPSPAFHPEITECSTYLESSQGQLRGVYNYRSLGTPCLRN